MFHAITLHYYIIFFCRRAAAFHYAFRRYAYFRRLFAIIYIDIRCFYCWLSHYFITRHLH